MITSNDPYVILTSNVILSSLSHFSYSLPPTEAGCNKFELPLVVREQLFQL